MGSGSSSIDQLDILYENNTSNKTSASDDNVKATAISHQSSRSSKNEHVGENGGNDTLNFKSKGKESKKSLPIMHANKEVNKSVKNKESCADSNKDANVCPANKMETVVIKTVNQDDDIIEQIAAENYTDPHKIIYELDTIGYYIANDDRKNKTQSNDNIEEKKRMKALIESTLAKKETPRHAEKQKETDEQKIEDRYEIFKKIYSSNRPKSRGRSKVANKHTLILVRVGSQFKYVAVPAYLPGQKLYKSSTFAKPYIERAKNLKKTEQSKGVSSRFLPLPGPTQSVYDRFNWFQQYRTSAALQLWVK